MEKKFTKEDYKKVVKLMFYPVDTKDLLNSLKEKNIITDEGFVITNKETSETSVLPFEQSLLLFGCDLIKGYIYMDVTIFGKGNVILAEYPLDNDIYNLMLLKYEYIMDKELFDLLVDEPDELVEKIFKYKDGFKLYKKIRFKGDISFASNPGRLNLSEEKCNYIASVLNWNKNDFKNFNKKKKILKSHLRYGDTQPAIVVSVDPLIISSYTDEIDSAVMLKFPKEFATKYNLSIGDRLITINEYYPKLNFNYAPDLIPGDKKSDAWRDVIPLVGLFLCENENYCKRKIDMIQMEDWTTLQEKTLEYLNKKPNTTRDGFKYLITK